MISVLGKGSYGKVMLVKKKDTGQLYALKVLKKAEIVRRNQVEHTMTERRILVSIINFCLEPVFYRFCRKTFDTLLSSKWTTHSKVTPSYFSCLSTAQAENFSSTSHRSAVSRKTLPDSTPQTFCSPSTIYTPKIFYTEISNQKMFS